MSVLSPAALKRARNSYYSFNTLNTLSFVFLSGSFITLFALRLGASKAVIGALNALTFVTFFFLPVGKSLVRRFSIIKVFSRSWMARYLAMLPALAAPALVAAGFPGAAFGCIIFSVAGFNICRGIGLIGNNPVLALLGGGENGSDRGTFIVNAQILSSLGGMVTNLGIAFVLGKSASLTVYVASMGLGIAIGIFSTFILLRIPEPEDYRPEPRSSIWRSAVEAFGEKSFRSFIEVYIVLAFISGMARAFLPVYAKEVFDQGDDAVMAYSLLASLGAIATGLLQRLLVDRLGSKPLYIIFTVVSGLSLVPLALLPGSIGLLAAPLGAMVFLGLVNFVSSFGFSGEESAGQTYFFGLVKPERTLDLGIVYFIAYGLGGTLGAGSGGLLLDLLDDFLSEADAWRAFFGFLLVVTVFVLLRMGRLIRLGSISVRESLEVILSIRDLRSFGLLARLDRSVDPAEEVRLIHKIGTGSDHGFRGHAGAASRRTQSELVSYLASPRFDVRMEALLAIEKMRPLSEETLQALVAEVERQPYTTAYVAARILGKAGGEAVLPCLRAASAVGDEKGDYMLRGSAIVALARLGDRASIPLIEDLIERTDNPRVRISAAYALELLGSRGSVPILVACLRSKDPPAFVSDELVLSSAAILGLMPTFYAMYTAFLESEERGLALLGDAAAERFGATEATRAKGGVPESATWEKALAGILAEPPDGVPIADLLLRGGEASRIEDSPTDLVLALAALDPGLGYRGFRFFIAAWAVLRKK